MAAPTPTVRGTPAGLRLKNGHSTKITFNRFPTVQFWEETVQPPGVDGGDAIETTTMHNTAWRTNAPRNLKTLTPGNVKASYDPTVFNTIVNSMINIEDTITVTFPDGSTLAFFGYLQKFEPAELKQGEQPEATISFVPTNMDATGAEQAPVLTSVAGT